METKDEVAEIIDISTYFYLEYGCSVYESYKLTSYNKSRHERFWQSLKQLRTDRYPSLWSLIKEFEVKEG